MQPQEVAVSALHFRGAAGAGGGRDGIASVLQHSPLLQSGIRDGEGSVHWKPAGSTGVIAQASWGQEDSTCNMIHTLTHVPVTCGQSQSIKTVTKR